MRSLHTATKSSPHSPQLEKAHAQQQGPNAAINLKINNKILKIFNEKKNLKSLLNHGPPSTLTKILGQVMKEDKSLLIRLAKEVCFLNTQTPLRHFSPGKKPLCI